MPTANYGFPVPGGNDSFKLPRDLKQLADAIDTRLHDESTNVDGRLTNQKYFVNINEFPLQTPEVDDLPRFKRAIDYLGSIGGGRLVVPKRVQDYVFSFRSGSTILNPTRILIRFNNIQIEGIGKPTIRMTGLTPEYLFSIDDYASSGRDIFTAFSFAGVSNCKTSGIRFIGEYTGNESFRYQSPRAIAVAFKGCVDCEASGLYGKDILGNLVNVVSSSGTYDAPYALSYNVTLDDCHAVHCLENGFNYMGGTYSSVASRLSAERCANGLESACENFTVNASIFMNNRSSGYALSGKNQVANGVIATNNVRYDNNNVPDPLVGYGLVVTGGENIQIHGGKYNDNYCHGIYLYPGVKDIQITGAEVKRNAKDATNKVLLQMIGTASKRIKNVQIRSCDFEAEGTVTATIADYTDDIMVTKCRGTFATAGSSMSFYASSIGSIAIGNRFNKPITMNDPIGEEYDNGQYRKVDRTSIPTTGTWVAGDIINNRSRTLGGVAEWSVTVSGTLGTLNGGATTGSIGSGTSVLTVSSVTGLYRGVYLSIPGLAGVKRVVSIDGLNVTLDNVAEATVTNVSISYRNPTIVASRQNGAKPAITSAPDYIGQIAVTGGTTPVAYIAVGTSSSADWKQINN